MDRQTTNLIFFHWLRVVAVNILIVVFTWLLLGCGGYCVRKQSPDSGYSKPDSAATKYNGPCVAEHLDNITGEVSARISYTYDSNGQILREDSNSVLAGGAEQPTKHKIYLYNEEGQLEELKVLYVKKGLAAVRNSTTKYIYNNEGKLFSSERRFGKSRTREVDIEYFYSESGQLVAEERKSRRPSRATDVYRTEYEYDNKGNLTAKYQGVQENGQVSIIVNYEYDLENRCIVESYTGDIKAESKNTFKTYEGDNLISLRTHYQYSSVPDLIIYYEYTYDDHGNMLSQVDEYGEEAIIYTYDCWQDAE